MQQENEIQLGGILSVRMLLTNLEEFCTSTPVLVYADFKKPFRLHTDASIPSLGAVLYQEQDGVEKVISYSSLSLSKSELKYAIHILECLCLKWAITDQFHEYLYGNIFDVYTDNNPLIYVLSTAKLDAMGHRWITGLDNYNIHIHYKSGKSNVEADTLSRIAWEKCDETNQVDSIQAIVVATIAGDLANIESVSCSMQAIDSFLPIQSESMVVNNAITRSFNQSHTTCPEHGSSELENISNMDDSDHPATRWLENKLNQKCMTIQDWVEGSV